jgi:hypothetical protein
MSIIKLCKMSQPELKKHLARKLIKFYPEVIDQPGFLYAQGTFPVLLVAHLDTVHDKLPTEILYDSKSNILTSPQGIGGDDRCGVYMILEIIKHFNCSVLFCEDEEKMGVGADKFTEAKLTSSIDFNYIIEFDRKNANDAVFYDCNNPDFEEFITKEFYKTNWGSFSDISIIAPYLGCAAVNLSCGYYNPHTTAEYINLTEMNQSIAAALNILTRTTESDKFEYIEARKSSKWLDYDWREFDAPEESYFSIIYTDEDGSEKIFTTPAFSEAEALGEFMMANPTRCFDDVIDFYSEEM